MAYSEQVLDHFTNPRHVGLVDGASGVGLIGDPGCGDFMCISIKVEDWTIVDIGFLCKGCPAAIASGSATTEIACGMRLEKAMSLTPEDVSNYLGGLSEEKMHCSNLGIDALRYAMADHLGLLSEEK
ncbi:iron-sulfur cluster assembly scaffold protein [bacterium]|nr:iron-sulfur cluster assembly scaffold protein [bacterium]